MMQHVRLLCAAALLLVLAAPSFAQTRPKIDRKPIIDKLQAEVATALTPRVAVEDATGAVTVIPLKEMPQPAPEDQRAVRDAWKTRLDAEASRRQAAEIEVNKAR